MAEQAHPGNVNELLFEKTLQAEILKVEDDILKCEFRNPLILVDKECEACDDGEYLNYDRHKGRFDEPFNEDHECLGKSAEECCYEAHNCVDPTEKVAVRPMIIYIAKPHSLRVTPFDDKTIVLNKGATDEIQVTYKYKDTGRERTATYNVKTPRCSRGEHKEMIWPPYRERVGEPGPRDNPNADFVPGDTIRYIENALAPEMANALKIIPAEGNVKTKHKGNLKDPDNPGAEALYCIDINTDSRKWLDDCGQGGGGGASVWV